MEPQANNWPLPSKPRLRILRDLLDAEEFEHFLDTPLSSARSASRSKARETAIPILGATRRSRRRRQCARSRHRHGPPRPPQRAGQHRRQAARPDLLRVRRQHRSRLRAGLGRREVPPRRERRSHAPNPASEITVSLAPNPSHLEAVDPVVEGIVRAKQDRLGDTERAPASFPS